MVSSSTAVGRRWASNRSTSPSTRSSGQEWSTGWPHRPSTNNMTNSLPQRLSATGSDPITRSNIGVARRIRHIQISATRDCFRCSIPTTGKTSSSISRPTKRRTRSSHPRWHTRIPISWRSTVSTTDPVQAVATPTPGTVSTGRARRRIPRCVPTASRMTEWSQ